MKPLIKFCHQNVKEITKGSDCICEKYGSGSQWIGGRSAGIYRLVNVPALKQCNNVGNSCGKNIEVVVFIEVVVVVKVWVWISVDWRSKRRYL